MIYLDHNATTRMDERVLEAMLPFLRNNYGNPSSLYRLGRTARTAIDVAREQLATLVDATASQVVFTSGGTEANNLALHGFGKIVDCAANVGASGRNSIAVSAIEHPSILEPATQALTSWEASTIPVNAQCVVTADAVTNTLQSHTRIASVMLANNETGAIQDISTIANLCRERSILFHCDAVQGLGKLPLHFNESGVHSMAVSSHKIYGPKGCGALILDKALELQPLFYGGGQEKQIRPGTENVAAIVGFGKAAELALTELEQRSMLQTELSTQLIEQLENMPNCTVFSSQAPRLSNTVQFALAGIDGEMTLMELDRAGIAVSSGSACASGSNAPSHVLSAMGIDELTARSAIRVSFGQQSKADDIQQLLAVIAKLGNAWDDED